MLVLKGLAVAFGLSLSAFHCFSAGFADQVIRYVPGTGYTQFFDDDRSVLGEPSRVVPVVMGWLVDQFNAAATTAQLVSVGTGGTLTVHMDSPILNAADHPFGVDFIIFLKSAFWIINDDFSGGGISGLGTTGTTTYMRVSVSSDGLKFFELVPPSGSEDRAFPTDGTGDFHTPLDPALTMQSFAGKGLSEIHALYAGSAGGTGFDLSWARDQQGHSVQLDSARFVRMEVLAGSQEIDGVSVVNGLSEKPGVSPKALAGSLGQWTAVGATNLFHVQSNTVAVTWDSSKTNSYFYHPLGVTLTRKDHFRLAFTLRLSDLEVGTTAGKPYAFEIAAGLLNLSNALDPEFFRGTGVNSAHGPRNVFELAYFADLGFGATVAPTLVTEANEFLSSDNQIELESGTDYRFQMEFTPEDGTLRSFMMPIQSGGPIVDPLPLKSLVLSDSMADFHLNALAISSYSDAGQDIEFGGSVTAHGTVSAVNLAVFERPKLEIARVGQYVSITFETSPGKKYFVEGMSGYTSQWVAHPGTFFGTGNPLTFLWEFPPSTELFRVRTESE